MLKWTTLPGEPERNSLVLKCDVSATGKKAHLYRHTDKHGAKICGSEALRAGLERVSIKVPAAVMERHCWAAGWRSVERRNPHLLWSTFQHVLQEGRGKWSACVFILWQRWGVSGFLLETDLDRNAAEWNHVHEENTALLLICRNVFSYSQIIPTVWNPVLLSWGLILSLVWRMPGESVLTWHVVPNKNTVFVFEKQDVQRLHLKKVTQ